MAGTDEPVRVLGDVLSTATDDGVAARLVMGVLHAVDAPSLSSVCPGPREHEPALAAAAFLDASALSVGLAWSARTALTLYDAHEGWSSGVDELEEEQGRDLVVRVAALAAVAVNLHASPDRGLAQLLDSTAGRSLLYVLSSVELLLSRGTAFEPVEPGVMADLLDVFGEAVDETLDAVAAAGGQVSGARGLVDQVAAAIEDAAEAVGDRIEDIAEAVRTALPQLDGGREEWASEARDQRVYGLLVGRLLAERDGVSAPRAAAVPSKGGTAQPAAQPTADLAPLREERARLVAQRGAVERELSGARARRRQMAGPGPKPRPRSVRPAEAAVVPQALGDAVRRAAQEVRQAGHDLRAAAAARRSLRAPGGAPPARNTEALRAGIAVKRGEAAVGALKQRRDVLMQHRAATQAQEARQRAEAEATDARRRAADQRRRAAAKAADHQRRATEQRRRRQLEASRTRALAERTGVAQRLQSAKARRARMLATHNASGAPTPAATPGAAVMPSRADVRRHAILRGELLRGRARVVTARADASRRMQAVRALRAPPPPTRTDTIEVPVAKRAVVQAAEALTAVQARLHAAQQARRSHTEQLRAHLLRSKARHVQIAPLKKSAAERRRRLATQRYANHRSLERSAARTPPIPREIPDTLTPERREQLEDVIFDANQALHRGRWALSRARAAQAEGGPAPPEAPDHRHIHRILLGARPQVASAERAVASVRARFKAAADARRTALVEVSNRRNQLLRALGSARRRRDDLRADRKTTGPRQRDVAERLAQHAKAPPPALDRTQINAATAQLDTTLSAAVVAQEALASTAARGGSLPSLPEPRAPRTPLNLSALSKVVRKTDKAVRRLQSRRAAALAELAVLRAPLEVEHTRLVDLRTEACATLETYRQIKSAAHSRASEVRARLAKLRTAQSAPPQPPPDPTDVPRQALAEAQEARAGSHRALTAALQAHEALQAAPEAGDRLVIAEATRHACGEYRAKVAAADAAVVAARGRQTRHHALTANLAVLRTQREQATTARSEQARQRDAAQTAQAEAAARTEAARARMATPAAPPAEDPELTLMRELTAVSAAALAEARTLLVKQPDADDPPTRPPAPDTTALTRRLSRARKVYAKYEKLAREVETRRDGAYVALRREHYAALSGARPTRRLTALRRRRSALDRALVARRERIATLQPTPASVPTIDPSLREAVTTIQAQLFKAREAMGQGVSAVAEVRGEMSRAKSGKDQLDGRIDEIDAGLARWTRRHRRAQRAIDRLRAQKKSAQAPTAPPPVTPLAPPPPPAPGVPVIGTPPPPVLGVSVPPPTVVPAMVEIAADPPSFEPPSAPPPTVPMPTSSGDEGPGKSSVQSLLARIAAQRQARKRPTPPRRDPDGGSVPPPMIPGLGTATTQPTGPPPPPPAIAPSPAVAAPPPAVTGPPAASLPAGPPPPAVGRASAIQATPPAPATRTEPPPPMAGPPPAVVGPPPAPKAPALVGPPPPPAVVGLPPSPLAAGPPPTPMAPAVMGPPPAPTVNGPPPVAAPPPLVFAGLPGPPPPSLFDVVTDRVVKPTFEDATHAPPPLLTLPSMPPPPPLNLPGPPPAAPPPPLVDDVPAPDAVSPPRPGPVPATTSNQDVLNAKTVILSLDDLRKKALDYGNDDDDDDDWSSGDGAATVLLSREEQLKRRDALLAELEQEPQRRREAWKPPGRDKTK